MKPIYPFAIALVLAGSACAHRPQSDSFTVAQSRNAVDVLLQTLAANGLKAVTVDRAHGTITTQWFDAGYRFRATNAINDGPTRKYDTDIFLRYRVSLVSQNGQQTVRLDTDVQRCSPSDSVITSKGVVGTCLPLGVLFPTQQKQADELGTKLKVALVGETGKGG
jgi:hypothetical protein